MRIFYILMIFTSTLVCAKTDDKYDHMPDVFLVTLDTFRSDHMGCYGYPEAVTPFLDRLSLNSVMFQNAFCPATYTNPSHASILSGLYPINHGVRTNFTPIDSNVPFFPRILSKFRYRTAAFVSGAPLKGDVSGFNKGFQFYDDNLEEKQSKLNPCPNISSSHLQQQRRQNEILSAEYAFTIRRGINTVRSIQNWLKNQDNLKTPMFIWAHFYDTHGPYSPPVEYKEYFYSKNPCGANIPNYGDFYIPPYQKVDNVNDLTWYIAMYDGEVRETDRCVNLLLNTLRDKRQKNLIAVVTADHGESLVDHSYFFDHGNDVYQPSLSVPLLFYFSDNSKIRGIKTPNVSLIDIVPTLAEILSISPRSKSDGISLVHSINSSYQKSVTDRFLYAESKPSHMKEPGFRIFCVVNNSYKYIFKNLTKYSELYNWKLDGKEQKNLNNIHRHLANSLRNKIFNEYIHPGKSNEQSQSSIDHLDEKTIDGLKSLGYIDN